MVRPKKLRSVFCSPRVRFFKPQGVRLRNLRTLIIPEEGLEALRFADYQNLEHEQAANLMNISRPTFSRILTDTRKKVATALVEGLALEIKGGYFIISGSNIIENDK